MCEECLLAEHQACPVATYLEWLRESSFEAPRCAACTQPAGDAPLRLLCLHTIHPACLDRVAASLPATTALAGYQCPTCHKALFPAPDQAHASPLARALLAHVSASSWPSRHALLSATDRRDAPAADASVVHAAAVVAARKKGGAEERAGGSKAEEALDDDKYRKRGVGELFSAMGFASPPAAAAAASRRDEAALAEEGAAGDASAAAAPPPQRTQRRVSRSSGALCTPRRFLLVFVLLFAVSTAVMLIATFTAAPAEQGS